MKILLAAAFIASALSGCIAAPEPPANGSLQVLPGGTYVLCEGLWRQDNSAMSYINVTGSVVRDVVANASSTDVLGDTGADMILVGDSLIIAMSTSQSLVVVDSKTGALVARVQTSGGREPYRLTRSSSSLYCTNLNDDSITEYDAATLAVIVERKVIGPAPEGIAKANGKLFIALSGLGDLRKDEQGAGTLQILNVADLSVNAVVENLPNAADVMADSNRSAVYVSYRHYASQPDSLGGVAKIDAESNAVEWVVRYAGPTRLVLDESSGEVYVLHREGIDRLNLSGATHRVISHTSAEGNDVWYSLGFDQVRRELLIGNARSFVIDGEVLRISLAGVVLARSSVAINPTAFIQR